jgi:hypothetical protein
MNLQQHAGEPLSVNVDLLKFSFRVAIGSLSEGGCELAKVDHPHIIRGLEGH